MKREDVKKLLGEGATDEVIDGIMKMHGADVESHKTTTANLTKQLETAGTQLTEANKQIEGFKGMNVDEIKKSADEYKAKFEQAQKDHAAKLVEIEFDRDFSAALTGAKAKYTNEVKARLKLDELKDDKGKFIAERFSEQIGKLKTDAVDLFESDKPVPRVVTGGENKPVISTPFQAGFTRGAGLEEQKKE